MSTTETSDIAEVVGRVQSWPVPMRIALARQILETLEETSAGQATKAPRGPPAAEVAAKFKTDKPAPDDATVEQWLDEQRAIPPDSAALRFPSFRPRNY